MIKKRHIFIIVMLCLALCGASAYEWRRWSTARSAIDFRADIVYGRVNDVELKLNLARPRYSTGPLPCLLLFHGGAWRAGNRADLDDTIRELARRGYVAVDVSYRFCPEYPFPAQVQDAKCAVRFLRANADKFNIDPSRIGAMGFSAGAYLALMLGTLDPSDGWDDSGGSPGKSSKVQAVVSFYGPTNFDDPYYDADPGMLRDFLGAKRVEKPEIYSKASPITYLNEGDAPVLMLHGNKDRLVPYAQTVAFLEAMQKVGVPGRLDLVAGADHGFDSVELTRGVEEGIAFFDAYLKKRQ